MAKPKPLLTRGSSTMSRRLLIGLGVLLVAGLLAGLLARLAAGGPADPATTTRPSDTAQPSTPSPGPKPSAPAADAGNAVARPAKTTSPTDYAASFAQALWTYDARKTTQAEFLTGLRQWLTPEAKYADPESVAGQVPDPVLWSRLRDNGQSATASSAVAHVPDSYTKAVAKNPASFTEAYIHVVTVAAKVSIVWDGGGRGAEDRVITLAIQCRPGSDCGLAAISSTVYP